MQVREKDGAVDVCVEVGFSILPAKLYLPFNFFLNIFKYFPMSYILTLSLLLRRSQFFVITIDFTSIFSDISFSNVIIFQHSLTFDFCFIFVFMSPA